MFILLQCQRPADELSYSHLITPGSECSDPGSEHSSIVGPVDDESLSLAGASKGTILEKVRAGDSCMPGALWHRS